MEFAVVGDNSKDNSILSKMFGRYAKENNININVKRYNNMDAFIQYLKDYFSPRKVSPVISLLDILFVDIDGDTADCFNKIQQMLELCELKIILLSKTAEYAVDGYAYGVVGYFLKPVKYEKLKVRLDTLTKKIEKDKLDSIAILLKNGYKLLSAREIYYIESIGHEMIFHTSEGEFVSREKPMKELEKELYNLNFRRCNLSYLVNLQYCSAIEGTYVKVGNEQLLISRAKRKSFIDEFRNYASI